MPGLTVAMDPLYKCIAKHNTTKTKFSMSAEELRAFQRVLTLISNPSVLTNPRHNIPFLIYTDASNSASGFMLAQVIDSVEKPIMFGSKIFNKHEINYSTPEKELLAIVTAIKKCKPFIHGQKIIVRTDHRAWTNNASVNKHSGRLARWQSILGDEDITLQRHLTIHQ